MAKPTLTPEQTATIQAEIQTQTAKKAALDQSAALQEADIAKYQTIDASFKALFDYYNGIIAPYDAERKILEGKYVASPVSEADIQGVAASLPAGRLVPSPPSYDVVRIPEFDNAVLVQLDTHEIATRAKQVSALNLIQNGVPSASVPSTLTTATAITPTSTSVDVTVTSTDADALAPGMTLLVKSGSQSALIAISSVTEVTPDTLIKVNFTFVFANSVSSGATFEKFEGFNNTERSTKFAADIAKQPLFDNLLEQVVGNIDELITQLSAQITVLETNQDPDGGTETSAALANANSYKSYLTSWKLVKDVSDVGITNLASQRSSRQAFVTTRLNQIVAAYTGRTENYFNQRYTAANNRGNTQRGTLRMLRNAEGVKSTLQGLSGNIDSTVASLGSILS